MSLLLHNCDLEQQIQHINILMQQNLLVRHQSIYRDCFHKHKYYSMPLYLQHFMQTVQIFFQFLQLLNYPSLYLLMLKQLNQQPQIQSYVCFVQKYCLTTARKSSILCYHVLLSLSLTVLLSLHLQTLSLTCTY